MTSNILSTQWVPELLDHANAHAFQQPARPPLRHPSRTDLEPALKKQRLDHDSLRVASSFESHVQRAGLVGTGQLQSPRPTILTTSVPDRSFPTPSNPSSTARLLFPTRSTAQQRQERTHCQNPAVKRSLHGPGEVRIKPYAPEIPSPAPRFSSTSKPSELPERDGSVSSPPFAYEDVADFSPWIGNHAEDVLSESATKHGFSDKIQISQAETSTARSSVWGSLKHKTHLQVLSSLVVSVLDQRQAHGTNTAGCTFKRPPRLGLTDSKREAWLRDLANPAISLRRLSRTIPYGITGRPLLDQCLGKNIPTARSLWLAKSVGANQLRAFKRKGASGAFAVGGESKWIRDWTANVEQFLDALIDSCSSPEWKRNLNYGLRLATHLLAEGLLDRDHYFDWLLSALNLSRLDTLPVYLFIVGTHLDELGLSRRCGHRLAESLLEHLHKIEQQPSQDVYKTLNTRIADLARTFVVSSPSSFLLPKMWQRYESIMQTIIGAPGTALHARFEDLRRRNLRLQALAGSGHDTELIVHQVIVKTIDSTLSPSVDLDKAALDLRNVATDPTILVQDCLEWSASIYRCGHARVYIAARLLREWNRMGVDIETPIIGFIDTRSATFDVDLSSFYRVVVELVRSRHFSVGRYLQWVIANGVLSQHHASRVPSCALGLILALPLDDLPSHVRNLRQNLLRSIGVSTQDEEHRIAQLKAFVDRQLEEGRSDDKYPTDSDNQPFCHPQDSLTVKFSIGHWIRQKAMVRSESEQGAVEQQPPKPASKPGYPSQLWDDIVRVRTLVNVLEDVGDYVTIAILLTRCSTSNGSRILALATVTISHYLDIFVAMGAADKLFLQIFRQQARLGTQKDPLSLLEALIDVAKSLPERSIELRALRGELQKHNSKLSVAAYSPVSEHMVEALQSDDSKPISASTDEVEQLLASGTSMDKRLLNSIFDLIWKRFEATWTGAVQSSVTAASLLSRLRTFDTKAVDELMILKLKSILSSESRQILMRVGMPLICAQSLSLEQLLSLVLQLLHDFGASIAHDELLVESIELLTANREKVGSSINHLYYRFYSQQQRLVRDASPAMVSLLQHLLRSAHPDQGASATCMRRALHDSGFLSWLRLLPSYSTSSLAAVDEFLRPIVVMEGASRTLRDVLIPATDGTAVDTTSMDRRQTRVDGEADSICLEGGVPFLMNRVGILSLPISCWYFQAILNEKSKRGEDASHLIISTMSELVLSYSTLKIELWASMITALPADRRIPIRDKAETAFFALLASTSGSQSTNFPKLAQCLLLCMTRAEEDIYTPAAATRILVQSHENLARLMGLLDTLRHRHSVAEAQASVVDDAEELSIHMKLDALVRLLHINRSASHTTNVSDLTITQLLVLLSRLLFYPFHDRYTHLAGDICDFLICVVEYLPPNIQSRCIRTLRSQYHLKDSRLEYIFGRRGTTEDHWLQLVTGSTPTHKGTQQAFPLRRWETLPDSTPLMTENDTSVSLNLFGARKAVL